MSYDADELTGWEEHVRDEGTWHDYVSEAFGDEARALEREARWEQEYAEAMWAAQQADPMTAVCEGWMSPGEMCPIPSVFDAEDEIPF